MRVHGMPLGDVALDRRSAHVIAEDAESAITEEPLGLNEVHHGYERTIETTPTPVDRTTESTLNGCHVKRLVYERQLERAPAAVIRQSPHVTVRLMEGEPVDKRGVIPRHLGRTTKEGNVTLTTPYVHIPRTVEAHHLVVGGTDVRSVVLVHGHKLAVIAPSLVHERRGNCESRRQPLMAA